MNSSTNTAHAVVIGGSMAGLLTARVLSDHFETVTVIERDQLPQDATYRNGTPQSRHLHLLLAHGETILEGMFPGMGVELETYDVPRIEWGRDTRFHVKGEWLPSFKSGMFSHVASRVTLERVVRKRLYAINNVTFLTEHQVDSLTCCDTVGHITGVCVRSRIDDSKRQLNADLVVDASGRGSKAPQWLDEMGYGTPAETVIDAFLGYATRWYQLPEDFDADWTTLGIQPVPDAGINRAAGAFRVEHNQLVVTASGINKDYPPTDEDGFMAFMQSLADPMLYKVIKDLEPITPIYGYRRTQNRQRHFEKMSRMPEGFIVLGDAACAFNPIYGQGMTTAALGAQALDDLLTENGYGEGFSMRFQKELARVVHRPWLMATGEDLRYPETEGASPNLFDRM
ncbi:MAG: FAD-dependent monooxygenase, partial [Chloroflexota bacterium]